MGTPSYSSSLYNPTQPWSSLDTDDWIKNDTWCKEYQPMAHWTISYSLSVSLIWTKKHRETPLIRCLRGPLETEDSRDLVEVDRSIQTLCKQGELERFEDAWKIQSHSVPGFLWGTQLSVAFYVNKRWPSAIKKNFTFTFTFASGAVSGSCRQSVPKSDSGSWSQSVPASQSSLVTIVSDPDGTS